MHGACAGGQHAQGVQSRSCCMRMGRCGACAHRAGVSGHGLHHSPAVRALQRAAGWLQVCFSKGMALFSSSAGARRAKRTAPIQSSLAGACPGALSEKLWDTLPWGSAGGFNTSSWSYKGLWSDNPSQNHLGSVALPKATEEEQSKKLLRKARCSQTSARSRKGA